MKEEKGTKSYSPRDDALSRTAIEDKKLKRDRGSQRSPSGFDNVLEEPSWRKTTNHHWT